MAFRPIAFLAATFLITLILPCSSQYSADNQTFLLRQFGSTRRRRLGLWDRVKSKVGGSVPVDTPSLSTSTDATESGSETRDQWKDYAEWYDEIGEDEHSASTIKTRDGWKVKREGDVSQKKIMRDKFHKLKEQHERLHPDEEAHKVGETTEPESWIERLWEEIEDEDNYVDLEEINIHLDTIYSWIKHDVDMDLQYGSTVSWVKSQFRKLSDSTRGPRMFSDLEKDHEVAWSRRLKTDSRRFESLIDSEYRDIVHDELAKLSESSFKSHQSITKINNLLDTKSYTPKEYLTLQSFEYTHHHKSPGTGLTKQDADWLYKYFHKEGTDYDDKYTCFIEKYFPKIKVDPWTEKNIEEGIEYAERLIKFLETSGDVVPWWKTELASQAFDKHHLNADNVSKPAESPYFINPRNGELKWWSVDNFEENTVMVESYFDGLEELDEYLTLKPPKELDIEFLEEWLNKHITTVYVPTGTTREAAIDSEYKIIFQAFKEDYHETVLKPATEPLKEELKAPLAELGIEYDAYLRPEKEVLDWDRYEEIRDLHDYIINKFPEGDFTPSDNLDADFLKNMEEVLTYDKFGTFKNKYFWMLDEKPEETKVLDLELDLEPEIPSVDLSDPFESPTSPRRASRSPIEEVAPEFHFGSEVWHYILAFGLPAVIAMAVGVWWCFCRQTIRRQR